MKLRSGWLSTIFLLLGVCCALRGQQPIDEALKRATVNYGERLRQANEELTQTRERIAREKAPLLKALREAEDRIAAAEAQITRLETTQEQAQENRRTLSKDADALRRNESYLLTVARDSLNAFKDGLLPGERALSPEAVQRLEDAFNDPPKTAADSRSIDVAELLLERVTHSLGGYIAAGSSLLSGDNRMVKGTYAFVGPEVFFKPEQGTGAGTVRTREGSNFPITHLLPEWSAAGATAFFQGQQGTIVADASAGKALRLSETKGTVWQHVHKGGVVSYAILAVGLLSLVLISQKLYDVSRMGVDSPERVRRCLSTVSVGGAEATKAVQLLKPTTRELFSEGLRHIEDSKERLEEHLTAVLLRQRLHFERKLPLLAVIATAAPLMGLLGTVTGMVRTFALITVFGTGNAGRLASGISEVLVATELGLIVAIPTLVAHGFLAHRIQKNLSRLEGYALEFVSARPTRTRREAADSLAV